MNLKRIISCLVTFFVLSAVASAQQATKADIQVLESKITSVDTKVTEMDRRLNVEIKAVKTTITEMDRRLNVEIKAVKTTIIEMDKRLTNKIDGLDTHLASQVNTLFWAIGALIGVVLTVIALPQLLGYFQEKRARSDFEKRMSQLEQRIEYHQQEIDELKSRRIVTPS